MKRFILLILFIGFLGCLFLSIPKSVESACPAGYTPSTTISGQTMCCKPMGMAGCIWPDSPSVTGGECCQTDTSDGGSNGAGDGWWLTSTWLTVNTYNVMVGQHVSGSFRIETKQNISSPCVDFGDGAIESFSACDGSDLTSDPEEDPLICEYEFSHPYTAPGTYTIIGSRWGCPSLLGANKTITVSEVPAPPPAGGRWNPLRATTTEEIIRTATNLIFYIISSLAVLFIMIGGFYILTAAGNPERINKGKKIILYTIIGFAIMAVSRGIIELVYLMLGVTI